MTVIYSITMEFDEDWNVDDLMERLNIVEQEGFQRDRVILKNLPPDLSCDGIRNICQEYGTIIDIKRPTEQNYAFVSFESSA